MTPLAVAGDVRLFVLDDEGILFAESRQELYVMNTAATFLWCLLEDACPLDRVVDAYASSFRLSRSEAEQHVYPTLRRWVALGYLSALEVPGAAETPISTALAFLLTNEELRRRFRSSPQATARALALQSEDLDAFLALDPDALERQADDIAEHRTRQRFAAPLGTVALDASDLLEKATTVAWRAATIHRFYRLVGTTFKMTMSAAFGAVVHPVLAHLEADPAAAADVELHVRDADSGYVIFEGMMPLVSGETIETLVPSLKLLLRRLAVARHRYFMEIHAGVVLLGDRAVLLPGAAGRGKTTLTAALVESGGLYFSDEIALLEEATLDVRPMPLTMTVKPGSLAPLRHLYPHLEALDEHLREDRQPVRYLPPPVGRCSVDQAPRPVKWVVFPWYQPGGETALRPLSRALGFRRLLDESLVLPGVLDRRRVERLVGWTRQLEYYDLRMSSLEAAVSAIRAMTT